MFSGNSKLDGGTYTVNFPFSQIIQTGYNHISHNLNNCLKAQFGYLLLYCSLSCSRISCAAHEQSQDDDL
jgi:hypothetical protein